MNTLLRTLPFALATILCACGDGPAAPREADDDPATSPDDEDDATEEDDERDQDAAAKDEDDDAVRPPLDSGSSRPSSERDASSNTPDAATARPGDASTSTSDASANGTAAGDACDRACLLEFMQSYYDALLAHDPGKVKVAPTVKYTENGVAAKLGESLWKSAAMLVANARLDFADPMVGNVASMSVIHENGSTPVIYMARLKVVKREVTEIEAMAVRRQGAANGFFNPANMVPQPVFLQRVPPEKRMTRDALNALTEQYLDYLEGKKRGNQLPFDSMCKRYENGQVTASGTSSFNSQSWRFSVTRRTLIIDEEAQITWGMYPFTQSANSLVVGEAFKLIEGKFMMIQAVMANIPAKAWE